MYHYKHIDILEHNRVRFIPDLELPSLPQEYFSQKQTIERWSHINDETGVMDDWWPKLSVDNSGNKDETQIYWNTVTLKTDTCKTNYSVVSLSSNKNKNSE